MGADNAEIQIPMILDGMLTPTGPVDVVQQRIDAAAQRMEALGLLCLDPTEWETSPSIEEVEARLLQIELARAAANGKIIEGTFVESPRNLEDHSGQ
ncbi:MAG TPA: hypothetical protein VI873_03115 [Candidatus Peribacteraceae bacterium]|nr:hypothetical protein [Candidatus Peribacteraceae bacterium]